MGQDRESIKKGIIQSTIMCIERDGIQSLTTRSVAKEAGVNNAAINYYFGSKDKLLDETLKQITAHFFFDLQEILRVSQLSAYGLLQVILTYFLQGMIRYPNLIRAFFFAPFIYGKKGNTDFAQRFEDFLERFAARLSKDSTDIVSDAKDKNYQGKLELMQMISAIMAPGFSLDFFQDITGVNLRDPKVQTEYIQLLLENYLKRIDRKIVEGETEDVRRILAQVLASR